MKNPFDKEKETQEHQLFNGVTEAINEWMLKKYPGFDVTLNQKIECLN